MPQPDNRRERGKTTQLPGLTVTPTGVRGTVGADGAAIGAAMSSLQDSAPTPIKIGQQARIVDDGSKLFTILQGAAVGGQQGIETYQKMYTYTSEKQFADFEAQLAEQHRLTGGDARKMAEWAKGSTYRPNDITAKKYNKAIAEIEGKDADVRENEQTHKDLTKISMMNNSDALDETNRLLKSADPDSRYFATLIRERNRLNGAVVGSAQRMSNRMYRSEIESTVDVLGTRLRGAGITAYDLDSERANNAARMYALMGGGDSEDGDPQRITIGKDGSIVYTDNSGTRHEGSFRGGISEELGEALKNDLGEFAGPLDDPNGIDTVRFGQLETVMQYGGFGTRHTSTRGSSGTGVGTLDPTAFIQAAQGSESQDVLLAISAAVPTAHSTGQVNDPKVAANARKGFEHMLDIGVQSANNGEFGITARNNTIDNLLQITNPVTYGSWKHFGYQSEEAFITAMGATRDKLVDARKKVVHEQITIVSEELTQVFGKTRSLDELRQAASGGAAAIISAMSNTTGNTTISVVNEKGKVVREIATLDDLNKMQINALDDGFAIRVNFNDVTNKVYGRGIPLHKSNPFIYIGQEGQQPPADTVNAITSYRGLVNNLKTLDRVRLGLQRGDEGRYFNPSASDLDISNAAVFLIGRMDPENPEPSTLLLRGILLDARVNIGTKKDISGKMAIALADDDIGPRVQQSFMPRNGQGFTVNEIIDPNTLPEEEDRAKLFQLTALYNNTATRNLALTLVGASVEGSDATSRSWTTFLLTEGVFYSKIAEEEFGVEPKDIPNFLKRVKGLSSSPAVEAMVNRDYMAPILSLSELSGTALESALTKLQADPIYARLAAGWIDSGQGTKENTLFDAISKPGNTTRDSAVMFVQKNIQLVKSRMMLGKIATGANDLMPGSNMPGNTTLNTHYGNDIAAKILESLSFWTGDNATIQPDVSTVLTSDLDDNKASMPTSMQAVRTIAIQLINRRNQDREDLPGNSMIVAVEALSEFGLDSESVGDWVLDDSEEYVYGPIRFQRDGESDADARKRAVAEFTSFVDGEHINDTWITVYIQQQLEKHGTVTSAIVDNQNEPARSGGHNYNVRYTPPDRGEDQLNNFGVRLRDGIAVRRVENRSDEFDILPPALQGYQKSTVINEELAAKLSYSPRSPVVTAIDLEAIAAIEKELEDSNAKAKAKAEDKTEN